MKTILCSTDFSAGANHAVQYGYNLAKHINANVVLCNAFIVPSEVPQAGMVVWPADDYDKILKDDEKELNDLKKRLEHSNTEGFKPAIELVNEIGSAIEVIVNTLAEKKADMLVTGTHHQGVDFLLLGNHTKHLIDNVNAPLLLVPPHVHIKTPQKIAFATDFKFPERDLELIYSLIPMAKMLKAEIYITHVYNEKNHKDNFKVWISQFLAELSAKADYPFIFSKVIKSAHSVTGFEKLCAEGEMDMLVMVHRPHGFFENLFKGSHTQKMAERICIPLLVFPS